MQQNCGLLHGEHNQRINKEKPVKTSIWIHKECGLQSMLNIERNSSELQLNEGKNHNDTGCRCFKCIQ